MMKKFVLLGNKSSEKRCNEKSETGKISSQTISNSHFGRRRIQIYFNLIDK